MIERAKNAKNNTKPIHESKSKTSACASPSDRRPAPFFYDV